MSKVIMLKKIAIILLSTSLCTAEPTRDTSDEDMSRAKKTLWSGIGIGGLLAIEMVQNNKLLKAGTIVSLLGFGMTAAVLCIASSQALRKHSNLNVESAKKLGLITAYTTLMIGNIGMGAGLLQVITQDIKSCIFPG